MKYVNCINQILINNNGIVTTSQITNANIPRVYLKNMVEKGDLIRIERGIYAYPTALEDEMFTLQSKYKKGIFSHATALFLHDLTDRTPMKYTMTFPLGYNATSLKNENVKITHIKKDLYEIGVITMHSPFGREIQAYNVERTICDILKSRSDVDIQIITEAVKRYARLKGKNIPLLTEYAKLFRVEKKVRQYLEVLL